MGKEFPMRRLASMRLVVCGLALAAPAATRADEPVPDQPGKSYAQMSRPKRLRGRHVCPECQMKAQMKADGLTAIPRTTVANVPRGVCVACQGLPGTGYAMTPNGGGVPGYAAVGDPSMSSGEPMPIGVMRAGYRPGTPWMAPSAPGYAAVGMGGAPGPWSGAAIPAASDPVTRPAGGRPHILAHLFGLPTAADWSGPWQEQKRSAHAAIRYGDPTQPVTELPASMVYRGR
jgi:hypothetical protein